VFLKPEESLVQAETQVTRSYVSYETMPANRSLILNTKFRLPCSSMSTNSQGNHEQTERSPPAINTGGDSGNPGASCPSTAARPGGVGARHYCCIRHRPGRGLQPLGQPMACACPRLALHHIQNGGSEIEGGSEISWDRSASLDGSSKMSGSFPWIASQVCNRNACR